MKYCNDCVRFRIEFCYKIQIDLKSDEINNENVFDYIRELIMSLMMTGRRIFFS